MKTLTQILTISLLCISLLCTSIPAHAQQMIYTGNIYALIVGISNYEMGLDPAMATQGELVNLRSAAADAVKFQSALLETGIPECNIRLITDGEATKEGIVNGLEWLAEKSELSHKAGAIFYYSGHGKGGIWDSNKDEAASNPNDMSDEAIVPYDAIDLIQLANIRTIDLETGRDFYDHLLIDDELANIYDDIKCDMVVLFDCCFSGGMVRGAEDALVKSCDLVRDDQAELLKKCVRSRMTPPSLMEPPPNVSFLLACQEDQKAVELTNLGGVFTFWMLQTVTDSNHKAAADYDHDGRITVQEAFIYSRQKVLEFTTGRGTEYSDASVIQDPSALNLDIADHFVLG